MGLPGCLFVCHLILLLVCFLFKYKYQTVICHWLSASMIVVSG